MTNKMKLFKVSQDLLSFLGFSPNQMSQKHFFNRNNLITFVICGLCSTLTFLFVIYEAKVFVEYVETIYILSAAIGCIVALATLRVEMFSKYIVELERIVDSSESVHLFKSKNRCKFLLKIQENHWHGKWLTSIPISK